MTVKMTHYRITPFTRGTSHAIGIDEQLDATLVQELWQVMSPMGP